MSNKHTNNLELATNLARKLNRDEIESLEKELGEAQVRIETDGKIIDARERELADLKLKEKYALGHLELTLEERDGLILANGRYKQIIESTKTKGLAQGLLDIVEENERYKKALEGKLSDDDISRIGVKYFDSIVNILAHDLNVSKIQVERSINEHYFTNAIREALKEKEDG